MDIDEKKIASVLDKLIDTKVKTATKKIENDFDRLRRDLAKSIEDDLNKAIMELGKIAPDDIMGKAIAGGLSGVITNAIRGTTDARTIAYSIAAAFNPVVRDFFNPSKAQQGEALSALLGAAQRNM